MTFDISRASLFAAVLILLGGYALVFAPREAAVSARYNELDAARASLEQNLPLARRIPALTMERSLLAARLDRVHVRDARAATVERFLHAVANVSARNGIAVESVAGDVRQAPPTIDGRRSQTVALFDEQPLEVTLRGGYGSVIHAVRELNGGDVAARISLASLGAADRRPGVRPALNAAFHVLLLREGDDPATHDVRPH
jgi:hypothetical protein